MARLRRTSPVLETFRQRLAGLKSINPAPDFGPGLTVPAYETKGNGFNTRLNGYNQQVAELDDEQNTVDSEEDELKDLNRRMLSAVEAQYGPDSSEYEAVGGTRTSERKRPRPQKPSGGTTPPA
jgi:hypothetical protein